MPMSDRAAQFSPFAALTGYDSAVNEAGRLTDERIELDENTLSVMNMKMQCIAENIEKEPDVTFTYFEPDKRKAGGAYITVTGKVKKIDDFNRKIVFQDGHKIPIDDVVKIDSDILDGLI